MLAPAPGWGQALFKQSYEIMPDMIKAGGDGLHQASILASAGFPATQGWDSTIAAPHMLEDAKVSGWLANYRKRWNAVASDYLITPDDGALIVIAAIEAVVKSGSPVTRAAMRRDSGHQDGWADRTDGSYMTSG